MSIKLDIREAYITKNKAYIANINKQDSRYTDFQKRGALGLVLHSWGGNASSAKDGAAYFNSASVEAAVHAVVDGSGAVYQLAPWNYRLWHVGGTANNTHIGVEMIEREDGSLYYDKDWKLVIVDNAKAKEYVMKVYKVAVALFAQLCAELGLDPLEDGVILSHSECHARGIGSGHSDPEHLWAATGSGLTMDKFRQDVAAKMAEDDDIDIGEGHEYSKQARRRAIVGGVINGVGINDDGSIDYAWTNPVTREQLVTILDRLGLL